MKNKNNSHLLTVLPYKTGEYYITIWNKSLKGGITFPYHTALGWSEVQQIFYDLTDTQIAEMLKDKQ